MRAVFRLDECSGSNSEAAMKNGEFTTPRTDKKNFTFDPFHHFAQLSDDLCFFPVTEGCKIRFTVLEP